MLRAGIKLKYILIGLFLLIFISSFAVNGYAENTTNATTTSKIQSLDNSTIGITLSRTCELMIKNNMSTQCPSYHDLSYYDNGDAEVFGKLSDDALGMRLGTNYTLTNDLFTDYNIWYVLVDPPNAAYQHMTHIRIDTKVMWLYHADITVDHRAIEFNEQRYIAEYCQYAVINAENWISLLPDTIYHMRNNCAPNTTMLNHTSIERFPTTYWNPLDSIAYQERLWLEDTIENCTKTYGACTEPPEYLQ